MEGIEGKLAELQKELLRLANGKKDYNGIAEMREFLNSHGTEITEYDEQLVRWLIGKVMGYEK